MAKRKIVDNRTVMLFGEISENNIAKVIDQFQDILDEDPKSKDPVTFLLSSEGGNVYDGFGLIGYLENYPFPVHIHCIGKIMSMALPIAVCGDSTTASPYCTFMYHEISNSIPFQEKIQHHLQETKECIRLQTMYDEFLLSKTKFTKKILDEIKSKRAEFYFSPKEAIRYGVISKIC